MEYHFNISLLKLSILQNQVQGNFNIALTYFSTDYICDKQELSCVSNKSRLVYQRIINYLFLGVIISSPFLTLFLCICFLNAMQDKNNVLGLNLQLAYKFLGNQIIID